MNFIYYFATISLFLAFAYSVIQYIRRSNEDINEKYRLISFGIFLFVLFTDLKFLDTINKEFKYIEETLGNSLGVSIGLALTQDKPIWLNVSDSIFQMGRVLEALPLLKKFNSNILTTIDFNNISRSKDNLYQKHYLKNLMDIYGIKTIYIDFENLNIKEIDNFINLSEPRVIIFETIKGFGVNAFIQDPVEWHYKTLNEIEYKNILEEL